MGKPVRTKTFKSGDGIAVRLPKSFGIAADVRVEYRKSGDVVTLRLKGDPAEEKPPSLADR